MAQDNAQNPTPTAAQSAAPAIDNTPIANGTGPAAVKGVDMGMIVDQNGPNINPAALEASARIQAQAAQPAQARPVAFTPVKFGHVETLNKPAAGKTATIQADPGEQFKVNFNPDDAQLSVRNDGDLVFTFNDGAQIVIDHFVMASNQMPSLMLPDGTVLAGGVVVAQLMGKSADDLFNIETAAGPDAGSALGGGNTIYSDDLGNVIDLLQKLPPIPFGELATLAAPERQPLPLLAVNSTPPAQQSINELVDETDGYANNTRTGAIIPDFGKDGPGVISLNPGFSADGSVAGGTLTSHGKPVTAEYSNGMVIGKDSDGHIVFTMKVNPDGTYEFKLLGQLDHANTSDPDDLMNLNFEYTVSDKDGDKAIGKITIGVKDDGPVAEDDVNSVPVTIHHFNIIADAPDFPSLTENTNLPETQPNLFNQGVTKASNVVIDQPTTILIDRIETASDTTIFDSPVFAFTYDDQGNISNVKLIFTNGSSNPGNNTPEHAEYVMTSPGKLGFFIARAGTEKLAENGLLDQNGNLKPGIEFKLSDDHSKIQYIKDGVTHDLMFDANNAMEPAFAGNFGSDVYGVAGRHSSDPTNVLRYGFEDRTLGGGSDKDYNDVQFKITVNPTNTVTAPAIEGNVLLNDDVGEDPMHPGLTNDTVVTQAAIGVEGSNNPFTTMAAPSGQDQGGKYVLLQGEYGQLKLYENGQYTYTYNSGKTTGDLVDEFQYTMRDQDGDTSSATLRINVNVGNNFAPVLSGPGVGISENALIVDPGNTQKTENLTVISPDGIDTIKLTTTGLPDLSSGGVPVVYTLSPDGKTIEGTANGVPVLVISLGEPVPVQGEPGKFTTPYTFTLLKPLDNPGAGENVTNIPVKVIVTDNDGDQGTTTLPLKVIDGLPLAQDDTKVMGTTSVATGNIITNDTFGADGANPANSKVTSITYGGVTKTFDTPDSVVSFTTPKGTLEIKGDGSYTFTRNADLGELNEVFNYTITDRDGDTSTAKLTITGNDNPVIITGPDPLNPYAGGNPAVLDEDDLPVPGTDQVVKNVTFTAPDGVQSIVLTTTGLPSLTSGGQPVTYALSPDGKTLTGSANGQPVFTVVLGNPVQQPDQSYSAPYTFTLLKPLDNPGAGENITNIPVKFVVTDTDGDNATGTLPLRVIDDVPVAVDDTKAMGTTSVATGNIITNDTFGADGANPANSKVTSISYGGVTKTFDTPNSEVSFTTPKGTLVIKGDGSYTFTRNADLGELNEVFNYTITDRDGDTSTAKLTITGNDNPVIITGPDPLNPYGNGNPAVLDEDDLPVPGVDQVTKFVTFTAPDGVQSIVLTTTGLPSLTSGGQPVTYALSPDGKTLTGSANGSPVFTVVLANPVQQPDQSYKANYTFTLYQPLDNPGAGENVTNIPVKFIATDTDGDSATGTLPLQVIDDVPIAEDDVNSVADKGTVGGNVITGAGQVGGADKLSADTPNKLSSVAFGGTTKSFANAGDVQTDGNGKFIVINGQYGQLKIYENGNYSYKHNTGSGNLTDQFTYVLQDRDGDSDPAKLTINITNGVPTIPNLQGGKIMDETNQLNTNITGTITSTGATQFALGDESNALKFSASGSMTNNALTSNGQAISVALIGGKYVGYTGADPNAANAKVFELTLNGSTYNYKQFSNVDHADGNNPNDIISLKFPVTVKDADGDSATGLLEVQVRDDAPVANPDTNALTINIHTYNVDTNAPDFPTLQERFAVDPVLFQKGVDKASNVNIGFPTTVMVDRLSIGDTTIFKSPLFAFTYDAQGNISNVKLLFANGSSDSSNNGPTHAEYQMGAGKLGFFLAGSGTDALMSIGAVNANGTINPNFTFSLQENAQGKYEIHYSNGGQSGVLLWNNESPLVARFAGDFDGQDIHGLAGRESGDPKNVLRYGFEDVALTNNAVDRDYNDVVIKVTIQPSVVETSPPIEGNVLPNDVVGQDDIPGLAYGTKVTQVSLGNGAFVNLTSQDAGGKFTTIQGEYGVLKIYENGKYTYDYNTGKKDGDLVDDFRYTIIDFDGDRSTTTLTINIGVTNSSSDVSAGFQAKTSGTIAAFYNADPVVTESDKTSASLTKKAFIADDSDKVADPTDVMHGPPAITGLYEDHSLSGQVMAVSSAAFGHLGDNTILSVNGPLTSHGEAVKTALDGGTLHGYTGDSYATRTGDVFTLDLAQDGSYRFDLKGTIDAKSGDPLLSFDYHAKDSTGAVVEGQIQIGIQDSHPVAVASTGSLHLDDVLGSQNDGSGDAFNMNTVASIDIINSILDDNDPHSGHNG